MAGARHSTKKVAVVLRGALLLLVNGIWRTANWREDGEAPGWSISEAIQHAGEASVECYHAKQLLSAVIGLNVHEWEANRWRLREEVLSLFRRGVEVAEGRAYRPKRRTGPVVSSGPRKFVAVLPAPSLVAVSR